MKTYGRWRLETVGTGALVSGAAAIGLGILGRWPWQGFVVIGALPFFFVWCAGLSSLAVRHWDADLPGVRRRIAWEAAVLAAALAGADWYFRSIVVDRDNLLLTASLAGTAIGAAAGGYFRWVRRRP